MAAAKRLQNIKAEVTCPICLELFWDPVTAECGHSFCRKCITRYREGDEDVACPQCKEKLRKRHLRPNRELRNIVEFLSLQTAEDLRGGHVCERHRQPLQLYCKKDQTPICVVCERAQDHRGHSVVPVEEAVQELWETIRKNLARIESAYESLRPLVSMDQKHLSPSAGEEAQGRLKRLAENLATLFKVHTEGPGQRFEALASQPQPREPDGRGRGRGVATRSELRGCQGREPGSEPAAEKQEETGSHVVHVCEEASTPKYGLDQASLDPGTHMISSTTEDAEPQVVIKSCSASPQDLTSVGAALGPAGSGQVGVSAVPVGRAALGREGPGGEAPEKQEATETPVSEEAAPPSPGAGNTPQGSRDASAVVETIRQHLEGIESGYKKLQQLVTTDWTHLPQSAREEEHQRLKTLRVHTEGPGQRFKDAASQTQPRDPDSGDSSPGREAAGKTESQGPAGPGWEAPEKQEETETPVREEAAPLSAGAGNTPQGSRDAVVVDAQQAENRSSDGRQK